MTDLRVPTTTQPVTITCTDGRAFAGEIFLPAHSSRRAGAMRLDEWSGTVPAFFPFRASDAAHSTIFNLDSVVAFTVPAGGVVPTDATDEAFVDAPVARVVVDAAGVSFEGDMVIDMPRDRQRVADWLNTADPFVIVRAAGEHHLIHKRHITLVVEMPENEN